MKKSEDRERRKKRKQEPPVSSPKAKLVNPIHSLPPKPGKAFKSEKAVTAKGKGRQIVSAPPPPSKQPATSTTASECPSAPGSSQASVGRGLSGSSVPHHLPPPAPETQHFGSASNSFPNCPPFTGPGMPELWPMQYWLGNVAPSYAPWQEFLSPVPSKPMGQPDHAPSTSYAPNVPPEPGPSISMNDFLPHRFKDENSGPFTVLKAVSMKKPKATLVIGCGPEADPQSTRCSYSKRLPNQPNPACTLVLDSIPQRYRTLPWVTNWASTAGQVAPVQVDVDMKRGRALIEFHDAAAARKAFASKQLRGKGRQAIRAWWYRESEVGSKSGVEELEEGEIEDTSAVKPLTRKQKKRLLKAQNVPTRQHGQANGGDSAMDDSHTASANLLPTGMGPSVDGEAQLQDFEVQWNADIISDTDPVAVGNPDDMSIASSRPPSIRCVTPPSNVPEDMITSSPVSVHPPMPHPSVLSNATAGPNPIGGPHEEVSASATIVDNAPALRSSTIPSDTPSFSVPQVAQVSIPPINTSSPGSIGSVDLQSLRCIPSEPRSFQTPPVAPSFTRRSLLARQKELEDNIAQSKAALAMTQNHSTVSPSCTPSTSSSTKSTPAPLEPQPSHDRLLREQNLRRLVIESKKKKKALSGATPPLPSNSSPIPISTPTLPPVPNGSTTPPPITKPIVSTSAHFPHYSILVVYLHCLF
ncbi:hypothetical protein BS17DRAFT_568093 [Gyrodon lividus]|nr:hypothetical protein BS17DRAFT_568093 [Gyrodon lividus]